MDVDSDSVGPNAEILEQLELYIAEHNCDCSQIGGPLVANGRIDIASFFRHQPVDPRVCVLLPDTVDTLNRIAAVPRRSGIYGGLNAESFVSDICRKLEYCQYLAVLARVDGIITLVFARRGSFKIGCFVPADYIHSYQKNHGDRRSNAQFLESTLKILMDHAPKLRKTWDVLLDMRYLFTKSSETMESRYDVHSVLHFLARSFCFHSTDIPALLVMVVFRFTCVKGRSSEDLLKRFFIGVHGMCSSFNAAITTAAQSETHQTMEKFWSSLFSRVLDRNMRNNGIADYLPTRSVASKTIAGERGDGNSSRSIPKITRVAYIPPSGNSAAAQTDGLTKRDKQAVDSGVHNNKTNDENDSASGVSADNLHRGIKGATLDIPVIFPTAESDMTKSALSSQNSGLSAGSHRNMQRSAGQNTKSTERRGGISLRSPSPEKGYPMYQPDGKLTLLPTPTFIPASTYMERLANIAVRPSESSSLHFPSCTVPAVDENSLTQAAPCLAGAAVPTVTGVSESKRKLDAQPKEKIQSGNTAKPFGNKSLHVEKKTFSDGKTVDIVPLQPSVNQSAHGSNTQRSAASITAKDSGKATDMERKNVEVTGLQPSSRVPASTKPVMPSSSKTLGAQSAPKQTTARAVKSVSDQPSSLPVAAAMPATYTGLQCGKAIERNEVGGTSSTLPPAAPSSRKSLIAPSQPTSKRSGGPAMKVLADQQPGVPAAEVAATTSGKKRKGMEPDKRDRASLKAPSADPVSRSIVMTGQLVSEQAEHSLPTDADSADERTFHAAAVPTVDKMLDDTISKNTANSAKNISRSRDRLASANEKAVTKTKVGHDVKEHIASAPSIQQGKTGSVRTATLKHPNTSAAGGHNCEQVEESRSRPSSGPVVHKEKPVVGLVDKLSEQNAEAIPSGERYSSPEKGASALPNTSGTPVMSELISTLVKPVPDGTTAPATEKHTQANVSPVVSNNVKKPAAGRTTVPLPNKSGMPLTAASACDVSRPSSDGNATPDIAKKPQAEIRSAVISRNVPTEKKAGADGNIAHKKTPGATFSSPPMESGTPFASGPDSEAIKPKSAPTVVSQVDEVSEAASAIVIGEQDVVTARSAFRPVSGGTAPSHSVNEDGDVGNISILDNKAGAVLPDKNSIVTAVPPKESSVKQNVSVINPGMAARHATPKNATMDTCSDLIHSKEISGARSVSIQAGLSPKLGVSKKQISANAVSGLSRIAPLRKSIALGIDPKRDQIAPTVIKNNAVQSVDSQASTEKPFAVNGGQIDICALDVPNQIPYDDLSKEEGAAPSDSDHDIAHLETSVIVSTKQSWDPSAPSNALLCKSGDASAPEKLAATAANNLALVDRNSGHSAKRKAETTENGSEKVAVRSDQAVVYKVGSGKPISVGSQPVHVHSSVLEVSQSVVKATTTVRRTSTTKIVTKMACDDSVSVPKNAKECRSKENDTPSGNKEKTVTGAAETTGTLTMGGNVPVGPPPESKTTLMETASELLVEEFSVSACGFSEKETVVSLATDVTAKDENVNMPDNDCTASKEAEASSVLDATAEPGSQRLQNTAQLQSLSNIGMVGDYVSNKDTGRILQSIENLDDETSRGKDTSEPPTSLKVNKRILPADVAQLPQTKNRWTSHPASRTKRKDYDTTTHPGAAKKSSRSPVPERVSGPKRFSSPTSRESRTRDRTKSPRRDLKRQRIHSRNEDRSPYRRRDRSLSSSRRRRSRSRSHIPQYGRVTKTASLRHRSRSSSGDKTGRHRESTTSRSSWKPTQSSKSGSLGLVSESEPKSNQRNRRNYSSTSKVSDDGGLSPFPLGIVHGSSEDSRERSQPVWSVQRLPGFSDISDDEVEDEETVDLVVDEWTEKDVQVHDQRTEEVVHDRRTEEVGTTSLPEPGNRPSEVEVNVPPEVPAMDVQELSVLTDGEAVRGKDAASPICSSGLKDIVKNDIIMEYIPESFNPPEFGSRTTTVDLVELNFDSVDDGVAADAKDNVENAVQNIPKKRIITEYQCNLCLAKKLDPLPADRRVVMDHIRAESILRTGAPCYPYCCGKCGECFSTLAMLQLHGNQASTIDQDHTALLCSACEFGCSDVRIMSVHWRNVHGKHLMEDDLLLLIKAYVPESDVRETEAGWHGLLKPVEREVDYSELLEEKVEQETFLK